MKQYPTEVTMQQHIESECFCLLLAVQDASDSAVSIYMDCM